MDHRVGLGFRERNYSLALSVIRTPDCPARSLVTIPAAFSQILPILRNKVEKRRRERRTVQKSAVFVEFVVVCQRRSQEHSPSRTEFTGLELVAGHSHATSQ